MMSVKAGMQIRSMPLGATNPRAIAAAYGTLAAAVVEAGRQPRARVFDLLIAATAYAHSARLYTRNADDLAGVDGLVEVVSV